MIRPLVGVACALALAGCGGWAPSWDLGLSGMGSGGAGELRLDSEPPGADARTSTGMGCRTPCVVTVPASSQSVTFTLPGYLPQTVPVQVRLPSDPRVDPNALAGVQFDPNPVAVLLEQEPPPVRRKPPPRRPPPPPR